MLFHITSVFLIKVNSKKAKIGLQMAKKILFTYKITAEL